jgi:hypothetical protein
MNQAKDDQFKEEDEGDKQSEEDLCMRVDSGETLA